MMVPLCFFARVALVATLFISNVAAQVNIPVQCAGGSATNRVGSSWTNPAGEGPGEAFDGSLGSSSKWVLIRNEGSYDYQLTWDNSPTPRRVESYQFWSGSDRNSFPDRDPQSWVLEGSDNGSTWTTLHDYTHSGDLFSGNSQPSGSFTIPSGNQGHYRFYRFTFTTRRADSNEIQLDDVALYGPNCDPPTDPPTFPPTFPPTSSPTYPPTAPAQTQTPGSGGDPHITGWNGQRFDFHGHCDLLLLKSPHFGQGKQTNPHDQGLAVHIRSAPYRVVYSYISNIAIQIGDDILEISSGGKHSINGEAQQVGATRPFAGYPVGSKVTKNGRYIYRIHLGIDRPHQYHGQELTIREYKDWISIGVHHASPQDFVDSIGLMGSYPQGTWYGRDGVTIHEDINVFGSDWIVRADMDGDLFHEPSPFPDRCNLPSLDDIDTKRRRLSATSVTRDQAVEACAKWVPSDAVDSCVMDVLIADDLEMAANEEM